MTRPALSSLAIAAVSLLAAAVVARAEPAASKDPAEAFWEAVGSYGDVKTKADADFAKATSDALDKRDAALASAYKAYERDHSRHTYDKWVAEAQDALARRLSPAADAWMERMRGYCTHTADAALALQGKGSGDTARFYDRARVGFTHQWAVDSGAFDRRIHDVTAFRPDEPADIDTLRSAHPEAFRLTPPKTEPTTAPATHPTTIDRPDRPIDVSAWIFDDDNKFTPTLYINGRDESFYRGHVKHASLSPFLTRYDFQLLPTDVITIGTTDRKTGVMAYLLTDRAGQLIAYSHPGLLTSRTSGSPDTELTSNPYPPAWEPAVRVPGRDLRPLRAAANVPTSLPADFGGIWVPSSKTGRCTVLVLPTFVDAP